MLITYSVSSSPQSLPLMSTNNFCLPLQTLSSKNLKIARSSPPKLTTDSLTFDSVSAVNALVSYTASREVKHGSSIHGRILKSGLNSNPYVSNTLLDMYVKLGYFKDAAKVFDVMPERTVVSWTSIISGYSRNGLAKEAILVFLLMLEDEDASPNEFTLASVLQACVQCDDPGLIAVVHGYITKTGFISDGFLRNSLVGVYAKTGALDMAMKLLNCFGRGDVVAWTSVISGYVFHGLAEEAICVFLDMQNQGVEPNEVTIISVLRACNLIEESRIFQCVLGVIMKFGFCDNELVLDSVIETCLVNGYFNDGIQIFRTFCFMRERKYISPETLASLLQGCGHSHFSTIGEELHGYLIKSGFFRCIVVKNSLIDMYTENEEMGNAIKLFEEMSDRDIVSWNTMAKCLVKNGQFQEALKLLKDVLRERKGEFLSPDFITILTSIQAVSNLAFSQQGEILHAYITKTGLLTDTFLQNALIDMYGRTGKVDLAEEIFKEMHVKDIGSYNSLIAARGYNGEGASALELFSEMKKTTWLKPNAITFVNILSACSHAGIVKEGFEIFDKIEPSQCIQQHYACMVDMLGRCGKFDEAETFIKEMPLEAGKDVWGALLGSCALFGKVEIAEKAAKELSVLDPESSVWRIALSNVYAGVGRWDDAARARAEVRKEGGWSSVELEGCIFKFMVNDTKHQESEFIYNVLRSMKEHMRDDKNKTIDPICTV